MQHGNSIVPNGAMVVVGDKGLAPHFVYKGGGDVVALRFTKPQKFLTQNLAEGKSSLNERPFVGGLLILDRNKPPKQTTRRA